MSLIQAVILAIIQGITEFLPISSSGHLNLFQHLFGLTPSLAFDIFLNTASLLSVLFFFRSQLKHFLNNILYIVIGSLPAALVGIFFKDQVELIFSNIKLLPFFFLITAFYLLTTKFLPSRSVKLDIKKALIIGIFQAFAILPAVSRSGSTIFAALLVGLSPLEAFNFSFSLFIPASLGALLLSFGDFTNQNMFTFENTVSFIITFIVGIFALTILRKTLLSNRLWYFGVYILLLTFIIVTFN